MSFLQKNKTLLIGLVVAGLGAFGYFTFFGDNGGALLTSSADESPVSRELLLSLSNLNTIRLDDTIFSNPVFLSLSDFGVQIPPENVGRRNPFAPL